MTAPTLIADDRESRTRLIPVDDLRIGHVVDFFGTEHRVDRLVAEKRGAIDEPTSVAYDGERNPAPRIALAADGWALRLLPGQMIPVRVPTGLYELHLYFTHRPDAPSHTIAFAAESDERAEMVARGVLFQADASWADVYTSDGLYVDTVAVS